MAACTNSPGTGRKLTNNSRSLLRFAKQQSAGIGADIATIKMPHNFSTTQCVKFVRFCFTLCHQKGRLRFSVFDFSQKPECHTGRPFLVLSLANQLGYLTSLLRNAGYRAKQSLEEEEVM